MADHSFMSRIEVLSVTDTGRRRRWTDAEKLRIVEESYAAPRMSAFVCSRRYVLFMRMMHSQEVCMNKRATNLTIDRALLDEARSLGINLSATLEASLREAVRARKAVQWQEENRASLQSSNEWVAKHGLPLEKYRQF